MDLRRRFWLWLGAVAALGAVFVTTVQDRMRVETDLFAMLPQVERDPLVEAAVRALSESTGRGTLLLAGAADLASAAAAADALAAHLQAAGLFERVSARLVADAAAPDELYGPHRAVLLSDRHRAWLAAGEGGRLAEAALRALYTPAGWLRARPFADDPLDLYGDFLAQQLPLAGAVQLQGDRLVAPSPQGPYVLVTAEAADTPFTLAGTARFDAAIAEAIGAVERGHPGSEVLCSAVVRHAAAAAARGTAELATFGSVSLGAIVLLVVLTFRALRPLALTLVSLGVGALAALTACHFLFERVHLITLVFGSTLTGVGVDYSIHYFADRFRQRGSFDPRLTLGHVGPAILVGMLATALGYGALLLLPFPGLRQMATFSIVGIFAACATVLLAYPVLAGRRPATHAPAALALARRLGNWSPPLDSPRTGLALALLAGLAALGLARLEFVDDVRALQSTPAWLKAQDERIRALLGGGADTRFFLVEGDTAEAVLRREEALRERLDAAVAAGELAGYQAVSRALPSAQRQRQNHAWMAQQVHAPDGPLVKVLEAAGYPAGEVRTRLARLPAEAPVLEPAAWRASAASAPLRNLWLEAAAAPLGRGHAAAVSLSGVRDPRALAALAEGLPGVQLVDRVARISEVLQRFRQLASIGLAAAFAAIGAALMLRYGAATGVRLMVAPLGGAALTLATLGLTGVSANLFNVLALLLVLGMGVDYAVFMREGRHARATVIMAILLAGLMTLLSFGLLAGSATPFIRSLGLTVALGVSYTFVLALLASGGGGGDNRASPIPATVP